MSWIIRCDSLIFRIVCKMPMCIGRMEHVRVGNDTSSFVRFSII